MKFLKIIIIFIVILGVYLFNSHLMSSSSTDIPDAFKMFSFWINRLLELPKTILIFLTNKDFYAKNELIVQFVIPVVWTCLISCFLKDTNSQFAMLEKLDDGFKKDKNTYVFKIHGLKQKICSILGWFFLTDLEEFVLYRFSICLPVKHKKTLKKQLRQMNRTQRILTEEGGNIMVTTFDKLSFMGRKKHINTIFENDASYECVLASGLLVNRKNYIAVDLIATNGVISRIQFQSDKKIQKIKGSLFLQDVVIHDSLVDKEKLYGDLTE